MEPPVVPEGVSHYRIIDKLGAGGMGEVYLAQDTKLGRQVALKILPAEVAANQERLRRFVQEAKAAASLNHPNIAHIYEIGEADGVNFIAMEFIDGQTLRQYTHRGQVDLGKLLRHLQHVAGGLAKAHAAGIVHRDLKPDNVMITRDNHAKILDFGLAKLIEPQQTSIRTSDAVSEVVTAILQQHSTSGRILGTAGYMSPEQAQGKTNEIDHRTDIFSFGCILFEAVTGHRAFEGKDSIDTLNKTIREPVPPIADFRPDAPNDLQRIVRRCLAKDPEDRYQTIKDVAIELRELRRELAGNGELGTSIPARSVSSTVGSPGITTSSSATQSSSSSSAENVLSKIKRHKTGVAVVTGAILLTVIALGVRLYRFAGNNQSEIAAAGKTIDSFNMKIARLTDGGKVQNAAISPDGKYIVYVVKEGAKQSIWLRQVTVSSNVQILAPAEVQYVGETFSPDGNFIYYVAKDANNPAGALYQTPVLSSAPRKILTGVSSPITFSPDATRIAFVRSEEQTTGENILMIANVDGTNERRLAVRKGHEWFARGGPGWSPDGKEIAVFAGSDIGGWRNFVVGVDIESGAQREFSAQNFSNNGRVCWLADKRGMVMNGADQESYLNQIWLISYPGFEARQITHDLNDYIGVSLTAGSKSLATVQNDFTDNIWVGPYDNPGQAKQITSGRLEGPHGLAWTPDGRIFFTSYVSGNMDIWIMNADGTNQKQLTDDPRLDLQPTVSPDGRYIVFVSKRTGSLSLWRMETDGGNLKQLTTGQTDNAPQISPDGRWVVFDSWRSGRKTLWKMPIDGGEPVQLTDKFTFWSGISPDGKLIACYYQEQPTSPVRVLVMPFEGGQPFKIFDQPTGSGLDTGNVGSPILWTSDGRAIMYLDMRGGTRNLWRQPLDGGKPVQLTNFTSNGIRQGVLSRDGKQIAFTRETITSDVVLLSDFR